MANKRKFPGGTIGWTGSTMRENQQEDIFLPCDDRLVAVNVGPDPAYGSLVYDTNQNNEYDADRSAWLQSAFRVLKKPLGGPNAIGFQLYFTGNGETKGGWFVDTGDGSTTKANVASPDTSAAGSGMVASGPGVSPKANKGKPVTYTTENAGASGGIIIGQGSYNDGGPFHVGNKADKHNNGKDADGNPINSLHIDTGANFYKNQAEDGPLRFENTYQTGQDAPIVVPVHLGWTGQDWAWWSTSHFYNPDPTPTHPYPYYPYHPRNPGPGVPTRGEHPNVPTVGRPTGGTPGIPTMGRYPVPELPTTPNTGGIPTGHFPVTTGGDPLGGGYGPNVVDPGGGDPTGLPTGGHTGATGGDTAGGGLTGGGGGNTAGATPQPGDIIGYTDDGIPIRQPPPPHPADYYKNPQPGPSGPSPVGPPQPHIPPDIPIYTVPDLPIIQDLIGGGSSGAAMMNTISSTAAVVSQATQFSAQNYNANSSSAGLFNGALASSSASAVNKSSNSDPLTGAASAFGSQGGTTPSAPGPGPSPSPPSPSPTPSPSPSPTPASTTGGQGDPWNYTTTPRGTTSAGKPMSKSKRGTASGGICYHPSETDLRDIPVGLVPPNTSLSTTTVTVGPNAYFAAGVPELVDGSIKSGYRWGVDTATGDLVFYSISFSQAPIEAVRFCNTGQVIRWRSTENVYGELSHANTSNRQYTFPDASGTVMLSGIPSGLFTPGSVPFANGLGLLTESNSSFFFNSASPPLTYVSGGEYRHHVSSSTVTSTTIYQSIFPGVAFYNLSESVMEIPLGSTIENVAAVAGFISADNAAPSNGVCLFGVARANVDNAAVWGINTLLQDSSTRVAHAGTGRILLCELDYNVMSPNTQVIGLSIGGNSLAQPTNATGFNIATLGTGYSWTTGLLIQDGSCTNGISVGMLSTSGVTVSSQPMFFSWSDAGATKRNHILQSTSNGFWSLSSTGAFNAFKVTAGSLWVDSNYGIVFAGTSSITEDGAGSILASPSANSFYMSTARSGQSLQFFTSNTSNTANSDAVFWGRVAGASAGDAYVRLEVNGGTAWAVGLDNSDGSKLKFSNNNAPGTNDFLTITTAGFIGFNTTAPRQAIDSLSTAGPQLRLTYTDNSVYSDFQTSSGGVLTVTPTGGEIIVSASNAVTATPIAELLQASTGDAAIRLTLSGGNSFIFGVDNSDGDKCKLSYGSAGNAALGTNDFITASVSGSVVFNNAALATNATDGFVYLPGTAGTPIGTPTTFAGRDPVLIDHTNNLLYFYSNSAWRSLGTGGGTVTGTGALGRMAFWDAATDITSDSVFVYDSTNHFLGVGTTTARAKVDSLSTTAEQFRATYTDNSVYTTMTTASTGVFTIAPSGFNVNVLYNLGVGGAVISTAVASATVRGSSAAVQWYADTQALDNKLWDAIVSGTSFFFRTLKDDTTGAVNWLQVGRTGTTIGTINFVNGSVGVNQATARRKFDVLDTAAAQARLTYTDNSVYTDLLTDSSGNFKISPTGTKVGFQTGANGQQIDFEELTELVTIAAAASTTTTIQIPLNAVVFAVSTRVTVAIPTAATFTVTGNTSGTAFQTAAVAVAVNTTDLGTASCPFKNGAAQTIKITPNLTPANNNGRVRVTIHFYRITPATS